LLARPPALFWAALALFALLFWPTATWLFGLASKGIWTSPQGIILAFAIVLLARASLRRCDLAKDDLQQEHDLQQEEQEEQEQGRESKTRPGAESSPWGLAFVALGLTLVVLDGVAQTRHLAALGFALCFPGFSLLLLGPRRTLALKAPLVLVMFSVPIPNFMADVIAMREISAGWTVWMLDAFGVPAIHQHALVLLPSQPYGFSYDCSGLQLVHSGLAIATILAMYSRSWLRRAALLLAVYPLALFFNALRTAVLLLAAQAKGPTVLETPLHGGLGNLAFWALMVCFLALADWPNLRRQLA
jgi:exosortase